MLKIQGLLFWVLALSLGLGSEGQSEHPLFWVHGFEIEAHSQVACPRALPAYELVRRVRRLSGQSRLFCTHAGTAGLRGCFVCRAQQWFSDNYTVILRSPSSSLTKLCMFAC